MTVVPDLIATRPIAAPTSTRPVHLRVDSTLKKKVPDTFLLEVVPATLNHLDAINNLVDYWAKQGENLPRAREEIAAHIHHFAVALHEGEVVGCASIHQYHADLAEIRSLGVDPQHHGLGAGSALVKYFVNVARQMKIARVFVLTRAPEFFQRNGFAIVPIETLPEKVFKDCSKCTKRSCCDEIAMIYEWK